MVWDVDSKALQNTEGKQQKQKKSWQMSSTSVAVKVGYFEGCADFHIYIYIYMYTYIPKNQSEMRNKGSKNKPPKRKYITGLFICMLIYAMFPTDIESSEEHSRLF